MHIPLASQMQQWDAYTILQAPIASIDLMERAADAAAWWLLQNMPYNQPYFIMCGRGNNGGDGLAIARLLLLARCQVTVGVLAGEGGSADFLTNLERLRAAGIEPTTLTTLEDWALPEAGQIWVDALYGTGLRRPLEGLAAQLAEATHHSGATVVSIDLPSGLHADAPLPDATAVKATYTLSFEAPKLAFFMAETAPYVGTWQVLPIGLHAGFWEYNSSPYTLMEASQPWALAPPYHPFVHKGQRGHVLIGAGSAAMMGAALLCCQGALQSGAGLITWAGAPAQWPMVQTTAPEVICTPADSLVQPTYWSQRRISAAVAGPGWPLDEQHLLMLQYLLEHATVPLVLDASALTLLSQKPHWLHRRAAGHTLVITPHVGEFDRLFGTSSSHAERLQKAREVAAKYNLIIVLKGAYSRVITPGGLVYFNPAANHGMAKAGSGDVLAGLAGGLLAQPYAPVVAVLQAVFVHGLAGKIATQAATVQGVTAGAIARAIPQAWKQFLEGTPTDTPLANLED